MPAALDVHRSEGPEELARSVARAFVTLALQVQESGRGLRVVLTGGTIADLFHRALADLAREEAGAGKIAGPEAGESGLRGDQASAIGLRGDRASASEIDGDAAGSSGLRSAEASASGLRGDQASASEIDGDAVGAGELRGDEASASETGGDPTGTGGLAWDAIEWWWGDERFVPADSPDRNAGQARAALLDHVPVDPERVHEMPAAPASGSAEEDAAAAATVYREVLPSEPFDLVMLGIGPDGHVASLFPEHPALTSTDSVTWLSDSPKPPPTRVTLTFPTLTHARQVWILASGESKRDAVEALLAPDGSVAHTPARGAHGLDHTLLWTDLPV